MGLLSDSRSIPNSSLQPNNLHRHIVDIPKMTTPNNYLDTWIPSLQDDDIDEISNDFHTDEIIVAALKADPDVQVPMLELMKYMKQHCRVFELNLLWKLAAIKFCPGTVRYEQYVTSITRTSTGTQVVLKDEKLPEEADPAAVTDAVSEIVKVLEILKSARAVRDKNPELNCLEILRIFCALMYMFGHREGGIPLAEFQACAVRVSRLRRLCCPGDPDDWEKYVRWPEHGEDVVPMRGGQTIWWYDPRFARANGLFNSPEWHTFLEDNPGEEEPW